MLSGSPTTNFGASYTFDKGGELPIAKDGIEYPKGSGTFYSKKEMNKLRAQARKLTSSQADGPSPQARKSRAQASSQSSEEPVSQNQGTSEPSPCPGYKQQE